MENYLLTYDRAMRHAVVQGYDPGYGVKTHYIHAISIPKNPALCRIARDYNKYSIISRRLRN
jgi:hypothetical protein